MPRKFWPHDRVIELLIGENLYTSADAAIRELIQNAEDACQLRRIQNQDFEPEIVVHFSITNEVVEIHDNGYGMNDEIIQKSFTGVAAPRDDVEEIKSLSERSPEAPIAHFGIGVLSCFGVAERVEIHTKTERDNPIGFVINNWNEDFEEIEPRKEAPGTIVKLYLKTNGPMRANQVPDVVRKYARHASHVYLYDADAQQKAGVEDQWIEGVNGPNEISADVAVRKGGFYLDGSWNNINTGIQSRLVACNGGFLVQDNELDFLPNEAIGFVAEIDFKPGALTILMNREAFRKDDKWTEIKTRLTDFYNNLLEKKLDEYTRLLETGALEDETFRAIQRAIFVLSLGPTKSILRPNILSKVNELLPQVTRLKIWQREELVPLKDVLNKGREAGIVYYLKEDEGEPQIRKDLQEGAAQISVVETVQTRDLRASLLTIRGFPVVSCRQHSFSVQFGPEKRNINPHEASIVEPRVTEIGVPWKLVSDAPQEHTELGSRAEEIIINAVLELGEGLKLAEVSGSSERVVRDYTARILNIRHPEVKEILQKLPKWISNPVRLDLLRVYMRLATWDIYSARDIIVGLLLDDEFEEKAQISTGHLFSEYLTAKINSLFVDGK